MLEELNLKFNISRGTEIINRPRIYVDNGGAPVTEEIGRRGTWPNKAPNIVTFIECTSHDLPSKSSGGTNH